MSEIELIAKVKPKNDAFVGIADASQVLVNTSTFTHNLSASGTTVQDALELLDNPTTIILTTLSAGFLPYHQDNNNGFVDSPIFTDGVAVFIGDNSNDKNFSGLTINQGDDDDEIISLKSSDISHTFTSITEVDTYGFISKNTSAGGLKISGFSNSDTYGLILTGTIGTTNPTDLYPAIVFIGSKSDGGDANTTLGNDESVLSIRNYNDTIFRIYGNGDAVITGIISASGGSFTNLTDGYIPFHFSDSYGLANSPINTDGTYTAVGTTITADQTLLVYRSMTNVAGRTFTVKQDLSVTENLALSNNGIVVDLTNTTVASGITKTLVHNGIYILNYVNNVNHQGILGESIGLYSVSGIYSCGVGGTITTATGILAYIYNNDADGTITTAIAGAFTNSGTSGTIVNRYGVNITLGAGVGTSFACGLNINAISGASPTNYGIKIDDITGATNKYAIYTGAGAIYFGDTVYINETANALMTVGLTINQGANDDEILCFKSSDVNQPNTAGAEADTYARFKKYSATAGGLNIAGYSDSDSQGIFIAGVNGSNTPTKTSIQLAAYKSDGATSATTVGNDEKALIVSNAASTELMTIYGDGDVTFAGAITADNITPSTVILSALTDGYIPYHVNDTDGLADSIIRTNGTQIGFLGIAPSTSYQVYIRNGYTNHTSGIYQLMNYSLPVYTDSTTRSFINCGNACYPVANTGANNGGTIYNGIFLCLRNNLAVDTDDSGTIANIRGISTTYGHSNINSSATPQTGTLYGLFLYAYIATGTITGNVFDIYIQTPVTGGTIGGVHYSIYQSNTSSKNYFGGWTGIGETANAKNTIGLTINQGVNDDEILTFKSSDIGHGMTTNTEADTYGLFKKIDGAAGGLLMTGFSDSDAIALRLQGVIGSTDPTDTVAAVNIMGYKQSGTGYGALGSAETVLTVTNSTTSLLSIFGNGDTDFTGKISVDHIGENTAGHNIVLDNGLTSAYGIGDDTNCVRLMFPGGASYSSASATVSGAFQIKLPLLVASDNCMLRLRIELYEYAVEASNETMVIECCGYTNTAPSWYNCMSTCVSHKQSTVQMRWGNDGTNWIIWIGELTSVWAYPKIIVTEVLGGYTSGTFAKLHEGWSISMEASAFDTVNATTTITDKIPVYSGGGNIKCYTYQADALADDGVVNLPDATSGMVFVSCNGEAGMWSVTNAGVVVKIAGSTNTAAADTDTDLCVYDGGTYAIVKNRLGTTGEIRIMYYYN